MQMQIKYVPSWSIVRLPDGRVGWLAERLSRGKPPRIILGETLGVEVTPSTEVEVIKYPAELAAEWLAQHRGEGG